MGVAVPAEFIVLMGITATGLVGSKLILNEKVAVNGIAKEGAVKSRRNGNLNTRHRQSEGYSGQLSLSGEISFRVTRSGRPATSTLGKCNCFTLQPLC